MYLNTIIRATPLKHYRVTKELKDQLAVNLVKIDNSFIPPTDCPLATKERQTKGVITKSLYSEDFILFRHYGMPILILMAGVVYSYIMMKQKREPLTGFMDKDYDNLTLRQLKQKENLLKQEKQFDSILDTLQNKLKDEYQEQLHEFQDYVLEHNKGSNKQ